MALILGYIVFALLNLGVGLLAIQSPRRSLLFFLFLLTALPSSNAYTDLTYRSGLFYYDFYFLGLGIALLVRPSLVSAGWPSIRRSLGFVFVLMLLMTFVSIGRGTKVDKYFLRDYRIFMLLLEGLAMILLVRAKRIALNEREKAWIAIVSAASGFFYAGLIIFNIYKIEDPFFEQNSFRYLSVGTYIAMLYVVYYMAAPKRLFKPSSWLIRIAMILSAASVLLSGARVVLLALIVALGLVIKWTPRRIAAFLLASTAFLGGFLYISIQMGVTRVTNALDSQDIAVQLFTRFYPGYIAYRSMQGLDFLFGKGLGFTFNIPWFAYRGLDTQNNFIDTSYITFAIKFGAFAVGYFWLFIRIATKPLRGRYARAVGGGILVLFLTYAVPYQGIAIGLFAGAVAFTIPRMRPRPESKPTVLKEAPLG